MSTLVAATSRRDTVAQLRERLAAEPVGSRHAALTIVVFLRQLQSSALFLRFVARRLVRATVTIQRFVRSTVLRFEAVLDRIITRWTRNDARAGLRSSVSPMLRRLIVKAEYDRSRHEFRTRFRSWLHHYSSVEAQYRLALDDRNRRSATAASAVRDRAAVLALRLTTARERRPRFEFVVDEANLVAQIDAYVRKETANKLERVMESLGVCATNATFVDRLVDRYNDIVDREKMRHRQQREAQRGEHMPSHPVAVADPDLARNRAPQRHPLGTVVSAMSHDALFRTPRGVQEQRTPSEPVEATSKPRSASRPPRQPATTFLTDLDDAEVASTPAPTGEESPTIQRASGDPWADLKAAPQPTAESWLAQLGIDADDVVPLAEERAALLPRSSPRRRSSIPEGSTMRSYTLKTVNPSPQFQPADTTPPSQRRVILHNFAKDCKVLPPAPPLTARQNRAAMIRLQHSTLLPVSGRIRSNIFPRLPTAAEPHASTESKGKYVYPGFQHPVVTAKPQRADDADATDGDDTHAVMKRIGAWTDGTRAFNGTTQLMLCDVSLSGLSKFQQVQPPPPPPSAAVEMSQPRKIKSVTADRIAAMTAAAGGSVPTARQVSLPTDFEWAVGPQSTTVCLALPPKSRLGPTNGAVVVGSLVGDVAIFDLGTQQRVGAYRHSDRVTVACSTFDSRVIVTGGDDGAVIVHHYQPERRRTSGDATGSPVSVWQQKAAFRQTSWITALTAVSSVWVAAGGYENVIDMYDVVDELCVIRRFAGHAQCITCLTAFDGGQMASGSLDGTVRVWRCTRGDRNAVSPALTPGAAQTVASVYDARVYGEHKGRIQSLEWLQDNLLVSASIDMTVRIFDGVNLQTVATFKLQQHTGLPIVQCCGPATLVVATSNSRVVQLVNVYNGRVSLEVSLPLHAGTVVSSAVLPGNLAVLGTTSGVAYVVDASLGLLVATVQVSQQPTSAVLALASIPTGTAQSTVATLQSTEVVYLAAVNEARVCGLVRIEDIRRAAKNVSDTVEARAALVHL
jgi:WD40 repeat protein